MAEPPAALTRRDFPVRDGSRAEKPLALTMGEPAGIGGEITLQAWLRRGTAGLAPFFAIADPQRLAALAGRLGLAVPVAGKIGRASCRERGCQYGEIPVVAGDIKKNKLTTPRTTQSYSTTTHHNH